MVSQDIPEKVLRYEKFVNETLKEDLRRGRLKGRPQVADRAETADHIHKDATDRKVLDQRDEVYADLSELLQLKNVIERLQESQEKTSLKTKVDLGCNFYVQAKVNDASMIFVSIGFGFFVEFTLTEALRFIGKKTDHLTRISDSLTRDASKIKAHIKLVLEGLREIQLIDDRPGGERQRDILLR